MTDGKKDRRFSHSDIVGALGLLAFFAIVGYATYRFWPFLSDAYETGGVNGVVACRTWAPAASSSCSACRSCRSS